MFRPRLALIGCLWVAAGISSPASAVDESPLAVELEQVLPELKFRRPLLLTHPGDGSDRLVIVEQYGVIHVLPKDLQAKTTKKFLDIESKVFYLDAENEQGLLGVAFHPRYRSNGQFFVYYNPKGSPLTAVISRFRVSPDDPDRALPESEEEIFRVERPFWNHVGGTIVFGPDGYLYVALGDGGKGSDPFGNGQKLSTLLGKILRIDVDHRDGQRKYAIPKDNPFAGREGARGEIWAYGLRNCWRIAFDRATGVLWAGDVGQDLWEEIDIITRGGNYGWSVREGKHPFGSEGSDARPELIDPIWEYHHDVGKSITGGSVYRGQRVPALVGKYLYADYVSGKIWALDYDAQRKTVRGNHPLPGPGHPTMSFGEDRDGEVYFLTEFGRVYRYRPAAAK